MGIARRGWPDLFGFVGRGRYWGRGAALYSYIYNTEEK